MSAQTLFLADDEATATFGRRLATALRPGDLLLLSGGLGSGKTALARAIIRTLCADEGLDVPSPSFALVQPYDAKGVAVLHADLYRLAGEREIDELGLFDRPDAIVIVEWPERAPALRRSATMLVTLAIPPGGEGRELTLETRDNRVL